MAGGLARQVTIHWFDRAAPIDTRQYLVRVVFQVVALHELPDSNTEQDENRQREYRAQRRRGTLRDARMVQHPDARQNDQQRESCCHHGEPPFSTLWKSGAEYRFVKVLMATAMVTSA
jgi:hypothetical protein